MQNRSSTKISNANGGGKGRGNSAAAIIGAGLKPFGITIPAGLNQLLQIVESVLPVNEDDWALINHQWKNLLASKSIEDGNQLVSATSGHVTTMSGAERLESVLKFLWNQRVIAGTLIQNYMN